MNLDMTFCSGLRCLKRRDCERWSENLKMWLDRHPRGELLKQRPISMGNFSDHDGSCDRFIRMESDSVAPGGAA